MTAVAASGGLAWFALDDEPQRGCADVGFDTQTSGFMPDDAMSAYVRSQGGDPADWASGSDRLEHAYHPRTAAAIVAIAALLTTSDTREQSAPQVL
jgi:hypothetical protein